MLEDIKSLVDRIISDGVMTNEEKVDLDNNVYADHQVSPEEQVQLDRLKALIESGEVKFEGGTVKDLWTPKS